jgi:hypothetical protein
MANSEIEERVMRDWALMAATGVAVLASASPSQAQGRMSGSYVQDRERSGRVFEAIDETLAGLPYDSRSLRRIDACEPRPCLINQL